MKRSLSGGDHRDRIDTERSSLAGGSVIEAIALPVVWGVVCLVFTLIPSIGTRFANIDTFGSIFGASAVTGLLALAVIVPLTAGDYDLSVAYTLTLSSVILAVLNVEDHIGIGLAITVALGAGVVIGFVNGVVTVLFGINSFITTLGTGTIVGGIAIGLSGDNTISGVAAVVSQLTITDRLLGIPYVFYLVLIISIMMWFVFARLASGRWLLYIGMGAEVARLSGVPVGRVRVTGFIISGLLSAIAGVAYTGVLGAGDPTSGVTLLLPAFAAAFLGATTIVPGRFNPVGSLVAVYFLGTGITGFELLGASPYVQDIFYGSALIVGVLLAKPELRKHMRSGIMTHIAGKSNRTVDRMGNGESATVEELPVDVH